MIKQNKTKILLAGGLIFFAVLARFLRIEYLPSFPNFEPLTAVSLLAGSALGGIYSFVVPLSSVAFSDLIIGNTNIFIFTWSAWMIIGMSGMFLKRQIRERKVFSGTLLLSGAGILAALFFYLYTNFGVWLLGGWYPKTGDGLLACYIAGLPFLRFNLLGNLIAVPVISATFLNIWKKLSNFVYQKNKIQNSNLKI